MTIQSSLLEPSQAAPLTQSVDWMTALLTGSLAIGLAVIGFALLGLLLLSGQIAIRRSIKVVIGAFLLFGAPAIAAGLMVMGGTESVNSTPPVPVVEGTPRADLPPADYDPYAGASLRRE